MARKYAPCRDAKENSLEFQEFDDMAFRKSAASSISGISRKPVGLEDFEDFDDPNESESEDSSLDQRKTKRFPKKEMLEPVMVRSRAGS